MAQHTEKMSLLSANSIQRVSHHVGMSNDDHFVDLEHHLFQIQATQVTNTEKVFGMSGKTPNTILRNYLTFLLRQCIAEHESIAYYNQKGLGNEILIKNASNETVKSEVWKKYTIFDNLDRQEYFKKIFATTW